MGRCGVRRITWPKYRFRRLPRFLPCGIARLNVNFAMSRITAFVTLAQLWLTGVVIVRNSPGPPNVITLSCKNRLPCRAPSGTVAAATDDKFGGSDVRLP